MKSELLHKWLMPIIGLIVVLCLGSILVFPMLVMEPKDIPIAIVSLDEGAQTPQGNVNAGEVLLEKVTKKSAEQSGEASSIVAWTKFDSLEELNNSLDNNEFYAAIIVPKDFTASQVAAQMGQGEARPVKLIINQGKNPMVASSLETALSNMTASSGIVFQTEYINPIPENMGMGTLQMVMMILACILSIATAVLIARQISFKEGDRGSYVKTAIAQLCYAMVIALCIGFGVSFIINTIAGIDIPITSISLFLAIASFALIILIIGCINWFGMAGMIVPVLLLILGLGSANMPYEFLPAFWQNWIHPWMPLRFITDGLREILYLGEGFWNGSTKAIIWVMVIGLAVLLSTIAKPLRNGNRDIHN